MNGRKALARARAVLVGCIALQSAWSQAPPTVPAQAVASAIQQQSIAQQRLSVQKQIGTVAQQGFFVLPPPSGVTRYSVPMANCEPLPSAEVDSLVTTAATAQSLNPDLLRAVIRQESGFRPCAVSSKGALGLMQLMPAT